MTKQTKITDAQAEALADAIRKYAQAQYDFEFWFMHSTYMNVCERNYESFEAAVEDHYRFFAERDHRNDQDEYIKSQIERCRRTYEEQRSGVVTITTSSHTIRALEKKGLIEIIKDGGRMYDKIRLLYV